MKFTRKQYLIIILGAIVLIGSVIGLNMIREKKEQKNIRTLSQSHEEIDKPVQNSTSSSKDRRLESKEEQIKNTPESSAKDKILSNDNSPDGDPNTLYYYSIPKGHGEGKDINFDDYGRDKKRYTNQSTDQEALKFKIPNYEDISYYLPGSNPMPQIYLYSYAKEHQIKADQATCVGYVYDQMDGKKLQLYFEYNDENKTLVTMTHIAMTMYHGPYIDVFPCQWTHEEIDDRVYEGVEQQ